MSDESNKPKPVEFEPVYYYSREHRLQRASQRIRDFNADTAKSPNVFASLTSTRSNTLLLITIMVICVCISILSKITREASTYTLAGTTVSASAKRSGAKVYLDITKSGSSYVGAVTVAAAPRSKPDEPTIQKIFFTPDEKETFYFSLPFQDSQVLVILRTETDEYLSMVLTCR
ncbi:MAG: hypothetical protein LBB43_02830 [Spirochaetaceae bacterium]|jgi:hypothetical protein|nr:hypothetical protein [Spirochaetaceae bacterium]